MKKSILTIILLAFTTMLSAQWISLDSIKVEDANFVPLLTGQSVTTRGVVTTHQELGARIVYFQNWTAGLVAYDTAIWNHVTRGDSIQVTGTLTNYSGLAELNPVTSYTILASGRPVNIKTVTPSMIRNATGEAYEGMLIKINGITAIRTTTGTPVTTWTTTATGTNYRLFVGSDSCDIRIYSSTNIANTTIPAYPFSIVALQSQYKTSAPYNSGYQIIPRDLGDILLTNIRTVSSVGPDNFSLNQNYPNPFNPTTNINSRLNSGTYETTFNSNNIATGMYFYSLYINGNRVETKKMMLIK